MLRITSLFPEVSYRSNITDTLDFKKSIEGGVIKEFFNENSQGKDKEILVELIIILALCSDETYSKSEFFTCDNEFLETYIKYKENECTKENETDHHRILLTKTLNNLSISKPY